jgi:hypothetical protein
MLDSMSRSPTERNAVDTPGSDAAVASWREMRVSGFIDYADPIREADIERKGSGRGDILFLPFPES